jgi:hypothetical protein
MYYFVIGLFVLGVLLGISLGYVIGKLWGELKTLRELVSNKRRTHGDIALFEDAMAVLTDLKIRQDVEKKRDEAVSHYFDLRMAQLRSILGEGRSGFDYESKASRRPEDY